MSGARFAFANAHAVTDFLVVGGDLHREIGRAIVEAAELVQVGGVGYVLDCRQEAREELWGCVPGVRYRWDGIDDAGQRVPGEWFTRITDRIHAAIAAGGVVLTHCHMGVNRGPSAGFAVLLREGWDPIAALDAIRRARPIAAMAYAEDALEWHLDRIGASDAIKGEERGRMRRWRAANPLPMARAIRLAGERRDWRGTAIRRATSS